MGAAPGDDLARFESCSAADLIALATTGAAFGRVALLSSFGAESAVLLHMLARVAPLTPVLMLNTGKLFGETLRYVETLREGFGLGDVRMVLPDPLRVKAADPNGMLWRDAPDRCCDLRKVRPMQDALVGFDATLSGRKRFQNGMRSAMPKVERSEGRVKINPLADWDAAAIAAYAADHRLPEHPLVADGFLSIGCYTCTDRVAPGEDPRAGRWRGQDKTECGIHVPTPMTSRLPRT